jgi:hypothetical protein
MCLGYEQSVPLIDRVDVEKCDRIIGLDQSGRRNLTADDLAEDAMRIMWYHECAFHALGSERSRSQTQTLTGRPIIRRHARHEIRGGWFRATIVPKRAASVRDDGGLGRRLDAFVRTQEGYDGQWSRVSLANLGELVDASVSPRSLLVTRTNFVE